MHVVPMGRRCWGWGRHVTGAKATGARVRRIGEAQLTENAGEKLAAYPGMSNPRRSQVISTVSLHPVELKAVVRAASTQGDTGSEIDLERTTTQMLPLDPQSGRERATTPISRLARGSRVTRGSGPPRQLETPAPRSVFARKSALLQSPRGPRRSRETLRVDDLKSDGEPGGARRPRPTR